MKLGWSIKSGIGAGDGSLEFREGSVRLTVGEAGAMIKHDNASLETLVQESCHRLPPEFAMFEPWSSAKHCDYSLAA